MDGEIRHGDLLLIPVKAMPPPNLRGYSEVFLPEGERTGHAHRLTATEILDWSVGGQRYVQVAGPQAGALANEGSDPMPAVVVPAGVPYRVVRL